MRGDQFSLSTRERQIADLDREVLGTEGRLIRAGTELLRELSAKQGRVLSNDFARTLAETNGKASCLVPPGPDRIVRGLCSWCAGRSGRSTPSPRRSVRSRSVKKLHRSCHEVNNEIGDIRARRRKCSPHAGRCRRRARAAVRALAEQRLAEESYRKLFEGSVDGIYVTHAGRPPANAIRRWRG